MIISRKILYIFDIFNYYHILSKIIYKNYFRYAIIFIGDKMNTGIIYNIDLSTTSNDIISVSSDEFNHFYIANVDDNGDEISYEKDNDGKLNANFFMIKLQKTDEGSIDIMKTILIQRDIVKVGISFTNGGYQEFQLAKKRIANNGKIQNSYEDAFFENEDLCIIVTDKNIKYKKNLFI